MDLKPCPFCGVIVICRVCGRDVVERVRNTRPIEDALTKERDAAERKLAEAKEAWSKRHTMICNDPSLAVVALEDEVYRKLDELLSGGD